MTRDDFLYAFIIAPTSRSRSHVRRIAVRKTWLKLACVAGAFAIAVMLYGIYGLAQRSARGYLESENHRLRVENAHRQQQLSEMAHRLETIANTSRRLAALSGASQSVEAASIITTSAQQDDTAQPRGAGGPELDANALAEIEQRAAQLEAEMRVYENQLRARMPSIWPAQGRITDGFGGRGNPLGGGYEFHSGQDIAAAWGAPVVAAGAGEVVFAGAQNGYGLVVVVDHGSGLTTRYGHLSHIGVEVGQTVGRGSMLGNIGSTGRSTGPHLHYEVRFNDSPINPWRFLPRSSE